MGLVLTREKGQVIVLDNELYIEIDEYIETNRLQIYVYDKIKDTEYTYDLYKIENNKLKIVWNNKTVYLFISTYCKSRGKKQVKIVLEADSSIIITRSDKIDYISSTDSSCENYSYDEIKFSYETDNILNKTDFKSNETIYKINKQNDSNFESNEPDLLFERYKNELSWFYN